MSNCPFCNLDPVPNPAAPKPGSGRRTSAVIRRAWRGIQWLVPAAVMALIPKCPLCVAAYVALFTGVGISVSTAQWIQILMWVFCLTALAYLAVRHWRRWSVSRGFAAPPFRPMRAVSANSVEPSTHGPRGSKNAL
jgi:hypothetical protein